MHIFAVVALASIGAWSCKYDDGVKPVDKTSVGRVTWQNGAIGGGPPASNTPNAVGSDVVPGDNLSKSFAGKTYPPPLSSVAPSASFPGGVSSPASAWHERHGRPPPARR